MENLKIDFYVVAVALLHLNLLLGLIHEWNVIFGVEIWVIWFLCHSNKSANCPCRNLSVRYERRTGYLQVFLSLIAEEQSWHK